VFHELTTDEISSIVDLMMNELRVQLISRGVGIALSSEARDLLAKEGFDPAFGARPLRRAIQRLVEDPLSEEMLAGHWVAGDVVELGVKDGVLVFTKGAGSPEAPVSKPARKRAMMPQRSGTKEGGSAGRGAATE